MVSIRVIVGVGIIALLGGCNTKTTPSSPGPQHSSASTSDASGPGILIASPVAAAGTQGLHDFGVGCGRWLQLVVGGDPAFGKTPLWSEIADAGDELSKPDMGLTVQDIPTAARALGVTNVAVGTISGSPAKCTITYQVYSAPGAQPVGVPIAQTGSLDELAAGLPNLARILSARLGQNSPPTISETDANGADMAILGSVPMRYDGIDPNTEVQIRRIAAHCSLGEMTLISRDNPDVFLASPLLSKLPGNAAALAHVVESGATQTGSVTQMLSDARRKSPGNYQLAACSRFDKTTQPVDLSVQESLAGEAAKLSPGNPHAWLGSAHVASDELTSLFRSVSASRNIEGEAERIKSLTAKWRDAAQHATNLDPGNAEGWCELSKAATYAGDGVLARKALDTAIHVRPGDLRAYRWSQRMFRQMPDDNAPLRLKYALMAFKKMPHNGEAGAMLLRALDPEKRFKQDGKDPAFAVYSMETNGPAAPGQSGPGVLICEPVGGDSVGRSLGSGCSRWLQFEIGGQASFGKTPPSFAVDAARRDLHLPDLRVSLKPALQLARMLGVTHVASASVTGRSGQYTLSYRLYRANDGTAVSAPIAVSGTSQQISDRLPEITQRLAKAAGEKSPAPVGTAPNAVEVCTLGSVNMPGTSEGPGNNIKTLQRIAPHIPVAGLTALTLLASKAEAWHEDKLTLSPANLTEAEALAQVELIGAANNPLVYAEIAHVGGRLPTAGESHLSALAHRFPLNACINCALAKFGTAQSQEREPMRSAWAAVCASHEGAYTWLLLGQVFGHVANERRQGRSADKMADADGDDILNLYACWSYAAARAAAINPRSAEAWNELTGADLFDSVRMGQAPLAFDRARSLSPESAPLYWRGLEMYQPKWMDDRDELIHVAEAVGRRPALLRVLAPEMMSALETVANPDPHVLQLMHMADDTMIRDHTSPASSADFSLMMGRYEEAKNLDTAGSDYAAAARKAPNDIAILYAYAGWLHNHKKFDAAIDGYKRVLALSADKTNALFYLARLEVWRKDYAFSEKLLSRFTMMHPLDASGFLELGNTLQYENKVDAARLAWIRAAHLDPENVVEAGYRARQNLSSTDRWGLIP